MKTIEEYYMEWAGEQPDDEDVDDPFTDSSEWKGHMVKGFINYILNEISR